MSDSLSVRRLSAPAMTPRLVRPSAPRPSVEDWRRGRNVLPPGVGLLESPFPSSKSLHLLRGPTSDPTMGVPRERSDVSPEPPAAAPTSFSLLYVPTAPQAKMTLGADVLIGNDFKFPFPVISDPAALAGEGSPIQQLTMRFIFERAALPDGTEVHKGTGKLTLLVSDGQVAGMLAGSVQLDAGAAIVMRATAGGIELPGHRGTAGRLHHGGAIIKDGAVVGLAAGSFATLDGVMVRTQRQAASYAFTAPDGYGFGAGAVVVGAPSDRAVRIEGSDVEVRTLGKRTRIITGGVVVEGGQVREVLAGAEVKTFTDVVDPAPRQAHAPNLANGKLVSWGSDADASLFVDGVSHLDVTQGTVGNCFFVAALISVARHRPDLIEQAIRANDDGTYTVRFFDGEGKPTYETIDADFYLATDPLIYSIYARSKDSRELWGPLFEKAFASTKAAGYETLDGGGYSDEALELLTGKETESWQMLFNRQSTIYGIVRDAVQNKKPIVAATGSFLSNRTERMAETGLIDWHAYAVIDAYEEGGKQYVVVRNPWGNFEFKANGYSADVDGDADGVGDGDDGTFRMTIEDFCDNFRKVSVLKT